MGRELLTATLAVGALCLAGVVGWLFWTGSSGSATVPIPTASGGLMSSAEDPLLVPITKTDQQWRDQLTNDQYYVTRQQGTEPAFTGELTDNKDAGVYRCVCCDLPLFASDHKFDSGTGWPSFDRPLIDSHLEAEVDYRVFDVATEVHCRRCGAHLGHVFDDGPRKTTGLRYCINSVSLKFRKGEKPDEVEKFKATAEESEPATPEADPNAAAGETPSDETQP